MVKLNESLKLYLLVVKGFKIDIKNFANFYLGVCQANKNGLKRGKPSTLFLCALQEAHIIPRLVPTGFRRLYVSSSMILETTGFL